MKNMIAINTSQNPAPFSHCYFYSRGLWKQTMSKADNHTQRTHSKLKKNFAKEITSRELCFYSKGFPFASPFK